MPINSNTPEIFRNLDGEGSVKLKKAITAGITIGGIAAGSILSENMSFTQFVQAIVSDDTDMSFSVIGWDKAAGTADPEAFSHIELDDDGNPTRPVTVKITVVPGRDDIELIEIQKIITTTDPISGDTVTKKVAAGKVPAKKASDRSGSSNEFIMDIAFTAEDATADSVDIRVSAYEYVVSPDHPAKPTVEPDTKPSNGTPSKIFTAAVSFGEGTATKATITAGSTQTVGDGTTTTFPIVGSVAIGDDGLTRADLTSLKICEGTTVLAESAAPTTDDASYTLTIVADYSVADHTVSKTLTTVATFGSGDTAVTKEASATYKVVATEVTATTAGVTTTATNPATDIENGTEVTFPLVGTVTIGDDGLTRADMTGLKLMEGDTVLATAADPTTDNVTYDAKITADYSSTTHTVSRTIKVVAEWGATVSKEGTIELKVVAKEPTGTTVKITSVPASPIEDVENGTTKTFALTGTVIIGTDGLTRADMTSLKIMDGPNELAASPDPTTTDVTFNLDITADYSSEEHTVARHLRIVGTWADSTTKEAAFDFAVVAKEPELKIYTGIGVLPPEAIHSLTPGGPLLPDSEYDPAVYPSAAVIAADEMYEEGNVCQLPCAFDPADNRDAAAQTYWTKHYDPATGTMVDGSAWSTYPEIYTTPETGLAAQRADIHSKRRPCLIGQKSYTLDSSEVAQLCSPTGFMCPYTDDYEDYYCTFSDDYEGSPSGKNPTLWNYGDCGAFSIAFPTEKFSFVAMIEAGNIVTYKTGSIDIDGTPYTWVMYDALTPAFGSDITIKLQAK